MNRLVLRDQTRADKAKCNYGSSQLLVESFSWALRYYLYAQD